MPALVVGILCDKVISIGGAGNGYPGEGFGTFTLLLLEAASIQRSMYGLLLTIFSD